VFAAIAAIMVTFSPDHSAPVGLAVFSGFGIATGLVLLLAAWLVFPAGQRLPSVLLGVLTTVAGMVAGIGPWRSTVVFFAVVISWALVTGVVEIVTAWRARATESARDGLTVGILTVVLGLAFLVINPGYTLEYYIEDAGQSFALTGITIAVGVFGGYAAIVAVYLGIAGLSPRRDAVTPPTRRSHEEADA